MDVPETAVSVGDTLWLQVDPSRVRFVEVGQDYEADVYIVPTDGRTWVELPCGRVESVVHVGRDEDMWYWAAHELFSLWFPAAGLRRCRGSP